MDQAMIDSMPYRFMFAMAMWAVVLALFFLIRWYIEHHETVNKRIDTWLRRKYEAKRAARRVRRENVIELDAKRQDIEELSTRTDKANTS